MHEDMVLETMRLAKRLVLWQSNQDVTALAVSKQSTFRI